MWGTPSNRPVLFVRNFGAATALLCVLLAQAASAAPPTPIGLTPGSTTSPGPTLSGPEVLLTFVSAGATYYEVGVRDLTTNALVVDTTTTATSVWASLAAGRSYRWNVRACDSTGCSAFTTPLYFQTGSITPSIPTGLSPGSTSSPGPVLGSTTVQIRWNSVSGATFYDFGIRDMQTGTLIVDTTTTGTSYSTPLSAGRTYRWNVRACNAANDCSSFTTPIYFQTPAASLSIPTGLSPGSTASPGPELSTSTVQIRWNAVSGATYYDFGIRDMQTGLLVVDTTTTGTSYTRQLEPGRTYRWNVQACNTTDCSGFTAPLYFQTPQDVSVPPVPIGLTPGSTSSPGPELSSPNVFLTYVAANATYYELDVRNAQTGSVVLNTTTSSSTYGFGTTAGTQYQWRVRACNDYGCSIFSGPLYFQVSPNTEVPPATPQLYSPGTPTSPGPTIGPSVDFSWSSEPSAQYYLVRLLDSASGRYVFNEMTIEPFINVWFSSRRDMFWTARACNDYGCSASSSPLYFQTPDPQQSGNHVRNITMDLTDSEIYDCAYEKCFSHNLDPINFGEPVKILAGDTLTLNIDFQGAQKLRLLGVDSFPGLNRAFTIGVGDYSSREYTRTGFAYSITIHGLISDDGIAEEYSEDTGCSTSGTCLSAAFRTNSPGASFSFSGFSVTFYDFAHSGVNQEIDINQIQSFTAQAAEIEVIDESTVTITHDDYLIIDFRLPFPPFNGTDTLVLGFWDGGTGISSTTPTDTARLFDGPVFLGESYANPNAGTSLAWKATGSAYTNNSAQVPVINFSTLEDGSINGQIVFRPGVGRSLRIDPDAAIGEPNSIALSLGVGFANGGLSSSNAEQPIIETVRVVPASDDSDQDGMPDDWEILYDLNPANSDDATADADGDGLTNLEEFEYGLNPKLEDTDDDGLTDGQEIAQGTDPLSITPYVTNLSYTMCPKDIWDESESNNEHRVIAVVTGRNFGAEQSTVKVNSWPTSVIVWADSSIRTWVPLQPIGPGIPPPPKMPGVVEVQVTSSTDVAPTFYDYPDDLIADDDGDGLPNGWETIGIDNDCDGIMQSPFDLALPELGADALRKDIFLEIDWMDSTSDHRHAPRPEALDLLKDTFANAPVENPDGSTGISLHIDANNSKSIPHTDVITFFTDCNNCSDFDAIKTAAGTPQYKYAFHYGLLAHQSNRESGGVAELPGNDFLVTQEDLDGPKAVDQCDGLDSGCVDRLVTFKQAAAIMHELGHNLNLKHGGDDLYTNCKPNYLSVMNYSYGYRGLGSAQAGYFGKLDFSSVVYDELDEENLSESKGMPVFSVYRCPGVGSINPFKFCTKPEQTMGPGRIDWNCNGSFDAGLVNADINDDQWEGILTGHTSIDVNTNDPLNDWQSLLYAFQYTEDFADGLHITIDKAGVEPTVDEVFERGLDHQLLKIIIDVMPGSDRNPIYMRSNGVVPVAVFSSEDFDASTIIIESATFAGADHSSHKGHLEDVNSDGRLDLVLHFETQMLTEISLKSTSASFRARTIKRQKVFGQDSVSVH